MRGKCLINALGIPFAMLQLHANDFSNNSTATQFSFNQNFPLNAVIILLNLLP